MQSRTQIATAMALFALLGLGATKAWTLFSVDTSSRQRPGIPPAFFLSYYVRIDS